MEIKLDQHFLENDKYLSLITDSININKNDSIFEIGPGKGTLTKKVLSKHPKKLISVEKDKTLKSELEKLETNENFELIFSNALIEIANHKFTKLIGNIPYSITEPLYSKILEIQISFIVLLHGKDFYTKHILDKRSKWHYFINAFYEIELIDEIKGEEFTPTTKVTSVILRLKIKNNLTQKELFFQNLFSKRKRTTLNALTFTLVDTLNLTKKEAKQKLEALNLSKSILTKKLELLNNIEFNETIENLIF